MTRCNNDGGMAIAILDDVRHSGGDLPAELRTSRYSDRLVIHVPTECGYSFVELDLADLLRWLRSGPLSMANGGIEDARKPISFDLPRD